MVGHTGVIPAGVQAVEVVDACLARLCDAVLARGGSLLDHRRPRQHRAADRPRDRRPAHRAHHEPGAALVGDARPGAASGLRDGGLADLAPSLCELLGLPVPREMTGQSLLVSR